MPQRIADMQTLRQALQTKSSQTEKKEASRRFPNKRLVERCPAFYMPQRIADMQTLRQTLQTKSSQTEKKESFTRAFLFLQKKYKNKSRQICNVLSAVESLCKYGMPGAKFCIASNQYLQDYISRNCGSIKMTVLKECLKILSEEGLIARHKWTEKHGIRIVTKRKIFLCEMPSQNGLAEGRNSDLIIRKNIIKKDISKDISPKERPKRSSKGSGKPPDKPRDPDKPKKTRLPNKIKIIEVDGKKCYSKLTQAFEKKLRETYQELPFEETLNDSVQYCMKKNIFLSNHRSQIESHFEIAQSKFSNAKEEKAKLTRDVKAMNSAFLESRKILKEEFEVTIDIKPTHIELSGGKGFHKMLERFSFSEFGKNIFGTLTLNLMRRGLTKPAARRIVAEKKAIIGKEPIASKELSVHDLEQEMEKLRDRLDGKIQ